MAEKESKFSARDIEIMIAVFQCTSQDLPTATQLDIPRLATITGLTEGSARTMWGTLRKKILTIKDDTDAAAPKTPGGATAKKTPASKRKKNNGDVDGESNETPSKKPRGRPAKAKGKVTEDEDSEMKDATEAPAKKKAAPKKTKATPKTPEAKSDGEDDELKDVVEVPVKKKAVPKKVKPSPKSPQLSSDETAHEDGAIILVETSEDTVKVESTDGKTEVTVTENEEAEDGEANVS